MSGGSDFHRSLDLTWRLCAGDLSVSQALVEFLKSTEALSLVAWVLVFHGEESPLANPATATIVMMSRSPPNAQIAFWAIRRDR